MRSKRSTYRPTSASTPVITSSGEPVVPAGKSPLAIVAPFLLGACYAAAVPEAQSVVPETAPVISAPPVAVVVVESTVDQPGEPMPELKEEVEPKVEAVPVVGFTRRIDRAKIEVRGEPRDKAGWDAAILRAAATFDNEAWSGDPRRELLAWLRGGAVGTDAAFTEADARIVARLQSGSGAFIDGKLRDETMAVLFATGFRFSVPKAMPREVRLEFYPGELEDLDAWNREIAETVTKKGKSFREVSPPAGEGSIYVRIGRSMVACYRGRGGPPSRIADDAKHFADPTKAGAYRLGPAHTHVTKNWYFSQIPWGAEIREKDGGYQFRWPGRAGWSWATSNPAGTLKEPLNATDFEWLPEVTRDGETFLIWNKNDFGPIAWNLAPSDLYVHTTPDAEAELAKGTASRLTSSLTASHGCIHLDPRERDEMMKAGYLSTDIPFAVRAWHEHVLPDQTRHDMVSGTGAASSPAPQAHAHR